MGKPRGGKAAVKDFEKKKQKLGKKKLAPTNSTSTQFKARSVVLPDQTIGAERGEPVSHRQLTMGELVGQLKHYSADDTAATLANRVLHLDAMIQRAASDRNFLEMHGTLPPPSTPAVGNESAAGSGYPRDQ